MNPSIVPLIEAGVYVILLVVLLVQIGRVVSAICRAAQSLSDLAHWQQQTAKQLNALAQILAQSSAASE